MLTQKLGDNGYGDRIGSTYHVPSRLFRLLGGIREGDRFVYYQPKEGNAGRAFFGSGVIERVDASVEPVRLGLREYTPFQHPVPKHLEDGSFAETGSSSSPFYLWSVRFMSEDDIDRVVRAGRGKAPAP